MARLHQLPSIHKLGKVTPGETLVVLRNINATVLMPRLRMKSPLRQTTKRSTMGSALVVRTERVTSDMKSNATGAVDLANPQTHVDPNRSNLDNNRYKTTGALVVLEPPMSLVAIETSAAPVPLKLETLPVTVVVAVASEKNQSKVTTDRERGQMVVFSSHHWKTAELGSVRVFLAVRSMLLALIWMNKKDLSLFNYPAVDFEQYGGVNSSHYCWTKVQEHFYSLTLQLDKKDDYVPVQGHADEEMPYHLARAVLSSSNHNMMSSSEW
jgi:hypothetical protein